MTFKYSLTPRGLETVIRTTELGCFCAGVSFSDSPEYSSVHQEIKTFLPRILNLPSDLQERLRIHTINMMKTVHMAAHEYEEALEISMQDPYNAQLMKKVGDAMSSVFQEHGIAFHPKDLFTSEE